MNIAVLYGGKSGEHEVSLLSGASVARHIPKEGNRITLIGIDRDGAWYLQDESLLEMVRNTADAALTIDCDPSRRIQVVPGGGCSGALRCGTTDIPADVVFPVLHGTFGEDGTIQGLFEMAELPYVGGGVMASSVAMDKEKTKMLWQQEQLPVVPFLSVLAADWKSGITPEAVSSRKAVCDAVEARFSWPVFVKPARAGSSVGACKAENAGVLETCLDEAFRWDTKVLVEPFISAREIECSVTGNGRAVAYEPGEIAPTHEFYDYDAKYLDPDGALLIVPARLSREEKEQVKHLACRAYEALELDGLSRVDFFLDKDSGKLYLNEINTIPGFTHISMFPRMCEEAGLKYGDLIMYLLDLARERFDRSRRLRTNRV